RIFAQKLLTLGDDRRARLRWETVKGLVSILLLFGHGGLLGRRGILRVALRLSLSCLLRLLLLSGLLRRSALCGCRQCGNKRQAKNRAKCHGRVSSFRYHQAWHSILPGIQSAGAFLQHCVTATSLSILRPPGRAAQRRGRSPARPPLRVLRDILLRPGPGARPLRKSGPAKRGPRRGCAGPPQSPGAARPPLRLPGPRLAPLPRDW